MSGKARSVGTSISIDNEKIGSLTAVDGPKLSSEPVDVTALDSASGYEEYLGGFKSGGDVSVSGFLDATSAGQKAMHNAFEDQEVHAFSIDFPNGVKWTFSGVVIGFETGANLKDPLSFAGTVKVSGKPGLSWPAAAVAINNDVKEGT